MSIYHQHHIIPKHMGGSDDPSNLIQLTIEEHAEAHRILWEKYNNIYDKLAWRGLLGLIDQPEIQKEILIERGKKISNSLKGKPAPNKGVPMSEEQKQKLRKPRSEETKQKMRKPRNNTENIGKYERTEEIKNKLRDITKNQKRDYHGRYTKIY